MARRSGDASRDRRHGRHGRHGLQRWQRLRWRAAVGAALLAAAVGDQLRRPRAQRTWHGQLLGVVPYDLRRPTLARVRGEVWAPDGHLLRPHAFGVGWGVNLGRAARLVRLVR